jgi:uncharacterized membrane protein
MPRLFSIKPSLSMKGRKFKGIRGLSGKPFHPPLTDIPVAAYVLVAVFDIISFIAWKQNPETNVARDFFVAGTYVIIAGAVVTVPTIITGFWDWLKSTPRRTQAWRTANWHMAVMLTMSMIVAADIMLRFAYWDTGYEQGADSTIMILSALIGVLVTFGALYGGAMVYEFGFNVEMDFDHAYTESESDHYPGQDVATQEKHSDGEPDI